MQKKAGFSNACSKDINDVFDDLLLVEEKLIDEGYQDGLKAGAAEGNPEGFHLGYHRGAEVGSELGYYFGVVNKYLKEDTPEKLVAVISKLKFKIEDFPKNNDQDFDIVSELENIRSLFKKFVALSKQNLAYPEIDSLSF